MSKTNNLELINRLPGDTADYCEERSGESDILFNLAKSLGLYRIELLSAIQGTDLGTEPGFHFDDSIHSTLLTPKEDSLYQQYKEIFNEYGVELTLKDFVKSDIFQRLIFVKVKNRLLNSYPIKRDYEA